jgi:chemotaxis methyl-accepting protein methylase/PAS domain-containing protein
MDELEDLLDYLKRTRGFDFRAYKRSTLSRRINGRMSSIGIKSLADYRARLENDPGEFAQLFNAFLINVTGFFRDPEAWQFIREAIIPAIAAEKRQSGAIRAWSAGCATGEEAFSIAIALAEELGIDAFRNRVKIFATDIDEHALDVARHATYDDEKLAAVPAGLIEKYFERGNGGYCFRSEVRRAVIFGRHDILHDAPISKIDLLACRNTMMYFNSEAQSRVLARLHFSLNDSGYLLLGRAETLLSHSTTFRPVNLKSRVFSKVPASRLTPKLHLLSDSRPTTTSDAHEPDEREEAWVFTGASDPVRHPQRATDEEMETTCEELQSAFEELETTNEQLQTSYEELESMNQELRSTNEDLRTVNDAARAYMRELDTANRVLQSIFTGLGTRVIVVDQELNVTYWNAGAEDLSGILSAEALNLPLSKLDSGLPLETLCPAIERVLDRKSAREVLDIDATNRGGKPLVCHTTVLPLMNREGEAVIGAIILAADERVN